MTPELAGDAYRSEPALESSLASGGSSPTQQGRSRAAILTEQALIAFRKDLPQLMQEGKWRWVAYHGEKQVAWGQTKFALYQECRRLGISDDEFMVRSVEPEWGELIVGPPPAQG